MQAPCETFPALEAMPGIHHGFLGRIPDLSMDTDRAGAMRLLEGPHQEALQTAGVGGLQLITAEQVHGNRIAVVDAGTARIPFPGMDGLLTKDPRVCLGIYVADCAAVYLVDTKQPGIGLVHSGRKGSELGIVRIAINAMEKTLGSRPGDLLMQISPCIRPPNYEIDFAASIRSQAQDAGVGAIQDCGVCTSAATDRYYSYRMEKGRTGRMLAFLALRSE